jgi:hypothetical protein
VWVARVTVPRTQRLLSIDSVVLCGFTGLLGDK